MVFGQCHWVVKTLTRRSLGKNEKVPLRCQKSTYEAATMTSEICAVKIMMFH